MGGDVQPIEQKKLEAKGVTTEQEARQFVDGLFQTMPKPLQWQHRG